MKKLLIYTLLFTLAGCNSSPSINTNIDEDSKTKTDQTQSTKIENDNNMKPTDSGEEQIYNEMFVVQDTLGNPVEGYSYKITTDEGKVYRGVTNKKGETIRVYTGNKSVGLTISDDFGD